MYKKSEKDYLDFQKYIFFTIQKGDKKMSIFAKKWKNPEMQK